MSRKELDYYRVVSTPSSDGTRRTRTREYVGPRYTLLMDAQKQRGLIIRYIAVAVAALAVHITAALWQIPSNVHGAVGGPAMMALVPMAFAAVGAVNGLTVKNGAAMEYGKFRATAEFRRYGAAVSCAILLYCTAACLVFTFVNRRSVPLWKEIAVNAEYLLCFLGFLWMWRTEARLQYDRAEGINSRADNRRV